MTNEQKETLLAAVNTASEKWKAAFNSGNATACADQYETDAVMNAQPFGVFTGTAEIRAFWQKLVDDGFSDIVYINPKVEVIDETSVILKSDWTMNNAAGVIHKELWVLQPDGTAKLRDDHFEALG
ncbi:MAG: nuclear transport factor 2 family protein [Lentisphaeria bacterium]|nr:nuclear transport factor 2 family protein [Lentisphaeria bacterium]